MATALFSIPVFLFLIFVDKILHLTHTFSYGVVITELHIYFIKDFGAHSVGFFNS